MSAPRLCSWRHVEADRLRCAGRGYLRYAWRDRDVDALLRARGVRPMTPPASMHPPSPCSSRGTPSTGRSTRRGPRETSGGVPAGMPPPPTRCAGRGSRRVIRRCHACALVLRRRPSLGPAPPAGPRARCRRPVGAGTGGGASGQRTGASGGDTRGQPGRGCGSMPQGAAAAAGRCSHA